MTIDQILKLAEAGYTAAEIKAMEMPTPDPKPEPAPAPDPKPEPAPAPDPLDAIKQQIQGLTDVVEKMSKSIVMPTLDDVTPLGIEDIITNFFKEE